MTESWEREVTRWRSQRPALVSVDVCLVQRLFTWTSFTTRSQENPIRTINVWLQKIIFEGTKREPRIYGYFLLLCHRNTIPLFVGTAFTFSNLCFMKITLSTLPLTCSCCIFFMSSLVLWINFWFLNIISSSFFVSWLQSCMASWFWIIFSFSFSSSLITALFCPRRGETGDKSGQLHIWLKKMRATWFCEIPFRWERSHMMRCFHCTVCGFHPSLFCAAAPAWTSHPPNELASAECSSTSASWNTKPRSHQRDRGMIPDGLGDTWLSTCTCLVEYWVFEFYIKVIIWVIWSEVLMHSQGAENTGVAGPPLPTKVT